MIIKIQCRERDDPWLLTELVLSVDPAGLHRSFLCFIRSLAGTESTFIISLYLSSSTNNNNLTLGPGIDFTTLY